MESWQDDPAFWETLDQLINESWLPLKNFLDVLKDHDDELTLQSKAMISGGIGTFVRVYALRRSDSNPPEIAFQEALSAVYADPRVRELTQQAADKMVDAKITQMKEASE